MVLYEPPGGSGATPVGALARTYRQDKNPPDDSTRITRGLGGSCRVHKTQGPSGTSFHTEARPKSLKRQAGRVAQSPSGRSGQRGTTPARRLLRPTSPTGAFASTPAASGWPLRSEGLAQNTTSNSDPTSLTRVHRNPAHRSSSTGTTRADWGHPTGDARSEGDRDEWRKQARAHKSNHDTRDHTLYTRRNSTLQLP